VLQQRPYTFAETNLSQSFVRVLFMSLSLQVQKLCQQAEQEKDFRKLLLLVSQINHVLKSQPPPSKGMLRSSIPDKQDPW